MNDTTGPAPRALQDSVAFRFLSGFGWTAIVAFLLFAFFWQMSRSGAPTMMDRWLGVAAAGPGPFAGSAAALAMTLATFLVGAAAAIGWLVTLIVLVRGMHERWRDQRRTRAC